MNRKLIVSFIAPFLLTLALVALSAFFGDFYFDLNDDVLMKDILSGAYTGTPEGHNIQMLYPVSFAIAAIYRIAPAFDWYGIFLCLCQFLCVFIVIKRIMDRQDRDTRKIAVGVLTLIIICGCFFAHLVFVQYTFTCGLLSATAAFLVMTHREEDKWGFVLPLILIILAYLIRSEMLLLTLPVVGVGILIKWGLTRLDIKPYYSEGVEISRYGDKKKLFKRYVFLCVAIIAGLVISQALHMAAYSGADWKAFNALFDARTELYDFQYIPDYAENKEFYDRVGISEAEQKLLINYNFGIDDEIGTEVLSAVASYAAGLRTETTPLPVALIQSIPGYLYRLRHIAFWDSYEYPMTDSPLNMITGVFYIGALITLLAGKEKDKKLFGFCGLILLFACRSSLWLYIIVRGRDPIRITHPLYLMEMAVLLGMIVMGSKDKKACLFASLIVSAVIAGIFIPNQISVVKSEMEERALMRSHYDELYDYFKENSSSFYFVDVYTSVSATDEGEKTFSEKMFENVDNSAYNHDLMGGWASKSPLYYEKLSRNNFSSMQDALLQDGVFFVARESSDIEWVSEYYEDKGIKCSIEKTDTVADVFNIYRLSKDE